MKYQVNVNGSIYIGNKKIPYSRFYEEAFELARFIRECGVSFNARVLVEVEKDYKSLRNIIAIVACGAVFIPIDKNAPQELKEMIIRENSAAMLSGDFFVFRDKTVEFKKRSCDIKNFVIERDLDDPLYIIYTSGTTGTRKGVIITSKNLLNYLNWFETEFDITSADSTFLATSPAFDLSYTAVFSALKSGASLYLPECSTGFNSTELIKLIEENRITYLKLTPQIIRMLLTGGLKVSHALRLVLSGGEKINPNDIARLRSYVGNHVQFVNHYGPTETTIGCCFKKLDFSDSAWAEYRECPSIGKPIANTVLRIVDSLGNEITQPNKIGELIIGGAGVGKGYVRGQQNRFKGNEFKSGDLAFYNKEHEVVLCGRQDDTVKMNGHRVALSEISRAVDGLDIFRSAACYYDKSIRQVKIFYVSDTDLDYFTIYDALSGKLPKYMLPTYYARVTEIPCTDNGKCDFTHIDEYVVINNSKDLGAEISDGEKNFYRVLDEYHPLGSFGYYDMRDKSFSDLGFSSLDIIELFCVLEEKFKITVETESFIHCKSIGDFCALILSHVRFPKNAQYKAEYKTVEVNDLPTFKKYLERRVDLYKEGGGAYYGYLPTQKYYYTISEQTENVLCSVFNVEDGFIDYFVGFLSTAYIFRSVINYKAQKIFVADKFPAIEIPYVNERMESDVARTCLKVLSGDSEVPYIVYVVKHAGSYRLVCMYKHAFILSKDFYPLLQFYRGARFNRVDDMPLLDRYIRNLDCISPSSRDYVLNHYHNFIAAQNSPEVSGVLGNAHEERAFSTGPITIDKTSQPILIAEFARIIADFFDIRNVPMKIFINNAYEDCVGLCGDHTDFFFTAIDCGKENKQNVKRISDCLEKIKNEKINYLAVIQKEELLTEIPNRTFYVNITVTHGSENDTYAQYIDNVRRTYKKSNIFGLGLYAEYNVDLGVMTAYVGADFDASSFMEHCKKRFEER